MTNPDLVIGPLPTNTNFNDYDMVLGTTISCTNCSDFVQGDGGYFVATIPAITNLGKQNIRTVMTDYSNAFREFINGDTTIYHTYKQPSLPVFPSSNPAFSISVKGVIVRKHSSPSLSIIYYSANITPNAPPRQNNIGYSNFIGSIASNNPNFLGMVYDFQGGSASNQITHAVAVGGPTITWSGTFTTFTDGSGTHHRVTAIIFQNGIEIDSYTDALLTDDPL